MEGKESNGGAERMETSRGLSLPGTHTRDGFVDHGLADE